jgi:ubiquitin C-terminal hydrolase
MSQSQQPQHAIAPSAFKHAFGCQNRLFTDSGQDDANECLVMIPDVVHEDLNQSPFARGKKINRSALSGMNLHAAMNQSRVVDLFHGVSHTRIRFSCRRHELLEELLAFWALPLKCDARSMTVSE